MIYFDFAPYLSIIGSVACQCGSFDLRLAIVIRALLMTQRARNYSNGVLAHSDIGSQHLSKDYKAILAKYNLLESMSMKDDCCGLRTILRAHSAVAESFFATIKK